MAEAVPQAGSAGLGDAGRSAGARALSGDSVSRAGGDLSHVPHAGSTGLLQQGRSVGPSAVCGGTKWGGTTGQPALRGGPSARLGGAGTYGSLPLSTAPARQTYCHVNSAV